MELIVIIGIFLQKTPQIPNNPSKNTVNGQ